MMKIFQRPQAIAMIVASALYLLLSELSITNPVIILFSLACVMVALWIAIPASLHRIPESHVDVVAITFPTAAVTLQQGVQGDAVPLPEREAGSLGNFLGAHHPLLFPGPPQAARERYLNSYLQQPITVYGQDLLLILFPVLSMTLISRHLERMPITLSASFGFGSTDAEILRCAQDDRQDTTQVRSSLTSKRLAHRILS
jgi:hypothetical protein